MFKIKYRIVTDSYLGYEAQYKKWWMIKWRQIPVLPLNLFLQGGINTSSTRSKAQEYIDWHKNGRQGRII